MGDKPADSTRIVPITASKRKKTRGSSIPTGRKAITSRMSSVMSNMTHGDFDPVNHWSICVDLQLHSGPKKLAKQFQDFCFAERLAG